MKQDKLIIIAGPCVIESKEIICEIAERLKPLSQNPKVDFYFKSSFDKANRTSLDAYRGPGLELGLEILAEVKKEFGYKILTDVHESHQAKELAKIVDVIQIPAFLCRQTDLLVEVAKTDCIVNIKKGQFLKPEDMKHQVEKILQTRGVQTATYESSQKANVFCCERGSSFGYGNMVVDMRGIAIMREFAPVIFDATHSVQMPGMGGKTGGDRRFAPILARAAAAVGVDGFFFETHTHPEQALSDAANMLTIETLYETVERVLAIGEA